MRIPHPILASGDDYGAVIWGAIVFGFWIITMIGKALKPANKPPTAPRVLPPPVPGVRAIPPTTPPRTPAFSGGRSQVIGAFRKPVAKAAARKPVPPPLPSVKPKAIVAPPPPLPPPVSLKRPVANAKPKGPPNFAGMLRGRLIWSEILGKPVALREDGFDHPPRS